MALKNGNTPDAGDINSIVLRGAMMAQANAQKAIFISTNRFDFNNMQNNSDGGDFVVDGFGTTQTMDTSNTTLVADNSDAENLSYEERYISHRAYVAKKNTELNATYTNNSSNITTLDLKTFTDDSEFVMHLSSSISLSSSMRIQISNGATHVDVHSRSLGGSGSPPDTYQDTIKVKIDKVAETAKLSLNGAAFGSSIDISSVTSNWYIRAVSAGTVGAQVFFLGYIDGTGDSVDYVSAAKTFPATKSAGVLSWDYNGSDSDITGYLSADNGSNYTSVTKDTWTTISNTGTQCKTKLTVDTPSTVDATSSDSEIYELKFVGAYFDG